MLKGGLRQSKRLRARYYIHLIAVLYNSCLVFTLSRLIFLHLSKHSRKRISYFLFRETERQNRTKYLNVFCNTLAFSNTHASNTFKHCYKFPSIFLFFFFFRGEKFHQKPKVQSRSDYTVAVRIYLYVRQACILPSSVRVVLGNRLLFHAAHLWPFARRFLLV